MAINTDKTVFVVDEDGQAREAIVALVRSKGVSAEGFSSPDAFLQQYDLARKGCVVLDLSGPSGLELLSTLKSRKCHLPIVAVTAGATVPLAVRAMQAGAYSVLSKPVPENELWQSMEQALAADESRHAQRRERTETEARLATLTPDELEVFRRLLAGHANKRIASDLDIGLRTVELRRSNIMKKMQATSLPDLVRMAILIEFLRATGPIEA
jgi:two-component system, LuxR family, response regulator FixJ